MTAHLFLSQSFVEGAAERGAAELAGGTLVVRGGSLDGATFSLAPAVRVTALAAGDADVHGLAGKVKRREELRALGAELVGDSLVLGELAYDVEPGFLTERAVGEQATKGSPPEGQSDAETLARFLLNTLA